jgi:hypothetical protein
MGSCILLLSCCVHLLVTTIYGFLPGEEPGLCLFPTSLAVVD